ncbi:hypothetical protein DVH24_037763 [Malus domestica]|uniref:Uncharacterized protein n=1 Tax=Malus domestica TaxID=3750 RepID=A0A498K2P2_MALDO|nr:hypothetical protein DVH24_037763 [Malus domestica]
MYNGLLEEVCEGSIGEGGLRFKVQKIQGMPLYAFPIFQKSCSWRRFETDLKLGYRDFIQFGISCPEKLGFPGKFFKSFILGVLFCSNMGFCDFGFTNGLKFRFHLPLGT